MMSKKRMTAWAASAVAVGTLAAGGVAAGVAFADPSVTPSPAATARPEHPSHLQPGKRRGHGLAQFGRRTVRGQLVVRGKNGKFATVDLQRGTVTKVSATSITVKSADGFTASYGVSSQTRIRKHGPAKISDIAVGDSVGVVAEASGGKKTARLIRIRVPHEAGSHD